MIIQKQQHIHNVHAKEAPKLLFIDILTKIANEKGIARRVVFVILQESNVGCQRNKTAMYLGKK